MMFKYMKLLGDTTDWKKIETKKIAKTLHRKKKGKDKENKKKKRKEEKKEKEEI